MKISDYKWAVAHQKVESGNYILRSLLLRNHVAQIQGPWKPGSKWSTQLYIVNGEFNSAWYLGKLTTRQRGVSNERDQIAAAMTWGTTNSLHPDLVHELPCEHIGWQKTMVACFQRFTEWVDAEEGKQHKAKMKKIRESPQTASKGTDCD